MKIKNGWTTRDGIDNYRKGDYIYSPVIMFADENGIARDGVRILKLPTIKIKQLADNFKMPIKGSEKSACYDCYATSMSISDDGKVVTYGLGFSAELPDGYSIDLRARSSVYKQGLTLCNGVGTIDNDYRNEFMAKFYTNGMSVDKMYKIGDRVCQMKLVKDYQEELMLVDELSDTGRGIGGFGSTGLK